MKISEIDTILNELYAIIENKNEKIDKAFEQTKKKLKELYE